MIVRVNATDRPSVDTPPGTPSSYLNITLRRSEQESLKWHEVDGVDLDVYILNVNENHKGPVGPQLAVTDANGWSVMTGRYPENNHGGTFSSKMITCEVGVDGLCGRLEKTSAASPYPLRYIRLLASRVSEYCTLHHYHFKKIFDRIQALVREKRQNPLMKLNCTPVSIGLISDQHGVNIERVHTILHSFRLWSTLLQLVIFPNCFFQKVENLGNSGSNKRVQVKFKPMNLYAPKFSGRDSLQFISAFVSTETVSGDHVTQIFAYDTDSDKEYNEVSVLFHMLAVGLKSLTFK